MRELETSKFFWTQLVESKYLQCSTFFVSPSSSLHFVLFVQTKLSIQPHLLPNSLPLALERTWPHQNDWPSRWLVSSTFASSFASHLWFTCPTISLESLFITKFFMPRALSSLKLVSTALYSALLFVAGNWSCTPYLRMSLSGDIMMTSTPPSSVMKISWSHNKCKWGFF